MPAAPPRAASRARRILLYGVTGSGKSSAAARIAAATGLTWVAVDDLTWMPGWQAVDGDEQRRRIAEACAGEDWILDNAYGAWLDVVLPRVELVVGLDYPRWLSLQRLLRRTTRRVVDKQPICNGNTETIRQALSRESIVAWHFRSFARKRQRMRSWHAAAEGEGPPVLLLRSPRELDRWISSLTDVAAG